VNYSTRILIALAASAALGASTGCSPPPRPDVVAVDASPDATNEHAARIGTGQSDWEDIAVANPELELIYGAQGGYHLWGRARFRGLQPDVDVTMTVTRLRDNAVLSDVLTAQRRYIDTVMMVRRGLLDVGGGEYVTNAEQLVLEISYSAEVVNERVRVDLTVTDRASGRVVRDSREAVVIDRVAPMPCVDRGDAGTRGG
jgi:hypothetical protein